MSESWLVALDIDGTVAHEDGHVEPAVRDAVAAAVDRGHRVTLATGRSWGATHTILAELGITPEYVVSANGAVIMKHNPDDPAADHGYTREFVETFVPDEALHTIRPHFEDGRYLVEYPDGFRRYTHGMTEWDLDNAEEAPFEDLLGQPVIRVVVVSPEHSEAEFTEIVAGLGLHQVAYAIGWTAWMDIAPLGVNKSTALERVRQWLDVPPSRVFVAGDGWNDLEMFHWARDAGRAIVMGQAPEGLRAEGTEFTGTIYEDGLVRPLNSLP